MSPSIFVFIALNCEARPLIRSRRLKKHPGKHPFAIYTGDERVVVVTGFGKVAMAGAVGYTLSMFPDAQQPLLLNLGIAGHSRHSLGSLYLADKIVDQDTGKKFYPQLPFAIACETATVATLAKPRAGYAEDYLYDMEAAAFYEMAVKFSSNELIHSLKIVSDNALSSLEAISENLVDEWISRHLDAIDHLIARIVNGKRLLPELNDEAYEQLMARFHFTASNSVKLKNLLQNWQLVTADRRLSWSDLDAGNGKELITWLEQQLEKKDFYL
jgi:adenosylhomocysteine nucleosidase